VRGKRALKPPMPCSLTDRSWKASAFLDAHWDREQRSLVFPSPTLEERFGERRLINTLGSLVVGKRRVFSTAPIWNSEFQGKHERLFGMHRYFHPALDRIFGRLLQPDRNSAHIPIEARRLVEIDQYAIGARKIAPAWQIAKAHRSHAPAAIERPETAVPPEAPEGESKCWYGMYANPRPLSVR